ncbi:MAG TPA: hypothetical protein VFC79_06830 [Tissierellaceae bacterium]|nr:hypothetical protein [Tissierellaceae bacterium]
MRKKGKFSKFLFGTVTVAAAATGIYYLYKNFINKDYTDDFDDFDDDFDDIFTDEASDDSEREYVSINIGGEGNDNLTDVVEDNEDEDDSIDNDLDDND